MNTTTNLGTNSSFNESFILAPRQHHDKVDYNVNNVYKIIFGSIAFGAFLGNILLCVAICKRRTLLRKTYNMLVLNLAVTDMLTG